MKIESYPAWYQFICKGLRDDNAILKEDELNQDLGILSGVVVGSLSTQESTYEVLLSLYHTWIFANNNKNDHPLCKLLIDLFDELLNIDDNAQLCGFNFESAFMYYQLIQCYTDACYNNEKKEYELQPLTNNKDYILSLNQHYPYECFKQHNIWIRVCLFV